MVIQQRYLSEEAKYSIFDATDHNSSRKSALGKKNKESTHPWKTSYSPERNFYMTTGESLAQSQIGPNGDLF